MAGTHISPRARISVLAPSPAWPADRGDPRLPVAERRRDELHAHRLRAGCKQPSRDPARGRDAPELAAKGPPSRRGRVRRLTGSWCGLVTAPLEERCQANPGMRLISLGS
jgi:hypothetical protein